MMEYQLDGRIVIISGASRGLGKSLALGFSRKGTHLGIIARSHSFLDELSSELDSIECEYLAEMVDVQDEHKITQENQHLHGRQVY